MLSTRFIFAKLNTMPCACGSAPPDKPVPAPRLTTGTRHSRHTRKVCSTCATVAGNATNNGACRYALKPSHS